MPTEKPMIIENTAPVMTRRASMFSMKNIVQNYNFIVNEKKQSTLNQSLKSKSMKSIILPNFKNKTMETKSQTKKLNFRS